MHLKNLGFLKGASPWSTSKAKKHPLEKAPFGQAGVNSQVREDFWFFFLIVPAMAVLSAHLPEGIQTLKKERKTKKPSLISEGFWVSSFFFSACSVLIPSDGCAEKNTAIAGELKMGSQRGFLVKWTGRRLVVKRLGVLSKDEIRPS